MIQIIASVISNREILPGTHLIWLECPQISSSARPGQYVMLKCGEDTFLRRPISLHQVDDDRIALLFTVVGKGTLWLSQRVIGDTVDVLGPLGNGFTLEQDMKRMLLIAGGIGIAPIRFLAQEAANKGIEVMLLLGAKNASQLYPQNLLPPGIYTITATDDGSQGEKGLITDILPGFLDDNDNIFACGPQAMYRSMAQMPGLRVRSAQISMEMRMACGSGVCYGCTIKTRNGLKQVCKDGPVFELSDIVWDEMTRLI